MSQNLSPQTFLPDAHLRRGVVAGHRKQRMEVVFAPRTWRREGASVVVNGLTSGSFKGSSMGCVISGYQKLVDKS
jgi:hypothetical protein